MSQRFETNAKAEDGLDVFGKEFDRFAFPGCIHRVTAGNGGEALLIVGSEKTAIIDCGMAYCGSEMIKKLKKTLEDEGRETLDFAFLTHSHYDHIGALPYIRKEFPDVVVYGSQHCHDILVRPGAKSLMKELGEAAQKLYMPESTEEIPVENLIVDVVLKDGDEVSLGEEKIRAMETKGHTDCSMSYALEPLKLLFSSESTGLIETGFQICTPILKSFDDAFYSLKKCRKYGAEYICLPHFGMIPKYFNEKYWDIFEAECMENIKMVREMKDKGFSEDQMLDKFKEKLWSDKLEEEKPIEAFLINTRYMIRSALNKCSNDSV